jgi:PAS domain-containing protein
MDVTETKRAEAERQQVFSLLNGIAGGAQDLIAALDHDFRLLYANPAYLREYRDLWGHDLREGESILEPMARWPEEQRKARELWSRALAGETFNTTIEFGPSDAERRTYDLRFNPVLDDQGRRIGAAHLFRDVSDRTRAETALRESEERQAFLLKLTDALRPLVDPAEELDEAMNLLIRHLGLARAAFYEVEDDQDAVKLVAGVGTDAVKWPERLKMSDFAPDVAQAYRSRSSYVIEDAMTDPRLSEEGREAIGALGVRALAGVPVVKAGRLMMVLSVQAREPRRWMPHQLQLLEEVAERIWSSTERVRSDLALKEATERLRDARQRQDLAAQAAGLGVWEWKAGEDRAIWEDERTREIFGLPEGSDPINYEDLERDFLHPDDKATLEAALEEGWRNGHYRVECRIKRASDGQLRWVEFSGRCEKDDAGEPARIVGVVADITERKQAEERQDMLMAELDHRVKNILAVVQSMTRQSLGRGETVGPEATDLLVGRLNALAQSHALLASGKWEGARFGDIVETAVAPSERKRDPPPEIRRICATRRSSSSRTNTLSLRRRRRDSAQRDARSPGPSPRSRRRSASRPPTNSMPQCSTST